MATLGMKKVEELLEMCWKNVSVCKTEYEWDKWYIAYYLDFNYELDNSRQESIDDIIEKVAYWSSIKNALIHYLFLFDKEKLEVWNQR